MTQAHVRQLRRASIRAAATLVAFALDGHAGAAEPVVEFAPNHAFVGGRDMASNPAVFEFDEAGTFVRTIPVVAEGSSGIVYGIVFGPDGAMYTTGAGRVFRTGARLATT